MEKKNLAFDSILSIRCVVSSSLLARCSKVLLDVTNKSIEERI